MSEQFTFDDLDQESKEFIFDDINKTLTDDLFSPIKQIYIDWTYIQDIYLGALVSLCKSQEEYTYLLEQLPNYNDRIIRGHASYFSKLGYTDTDLENYINHNKDIGLLLLGTSPMTNIFTNLQQLIKDIHLRNSKLEYRKSLHLIVNLYPIRLEEEYITLLTYMINQAYPGVSLEIISQPINTLDIQMLLDCDILLIERMDIFFTKNTITANTFFDEENFPFSKIAVITPKVIDNEEIVKELSSKTNDDIEHMFRVTLNICSMMSKFYFINPIILVDNPQENNKV